MTTKIILNIFNKHFAPFETVKGNCEWDFGSESPKLIVIRLVCFSQLAHYETYRTFAPIEDVKINMPPNQGSYDFNFSLPGFPYTYEGQLFNIQYAIEAQIDSGEKCQEIIVCKPLA